MIQEYFIGLDAHSATSTFVSLNKEGEILTQCKVDTSEKNLLGFLRAQKGVKNLVFEETNLSKWLYALLKKEVDNLVICNPLYIGKRPGPKNDFRDALNLAHELRCNHVVAVFHTKNEIIDLRAVTGAYTDLIHLFTSTKNRYKALFRSQGLNTTGRGIYNQPERINDVRLTA